MMSGTFQQKYDRARPSYVRVNEKQFADLPAGTTILIPSPRDIEDALLELAPGEFILPKELRRRLAEEHGTDGACPVMTGMNLRIVAELALNRVDAGFSAREIVPVWQVITPDSALAHKLPGGPKRIAQLRDQTQSHSGPEVGRPFPALPD